MVFKNPDILYALFALLIPILIHLFQFRRFKTVWFSNVHALKNLKKQSRKSRKLKELLILLSRLLALAALILAFAEPEIPAQKNPDQNHLAIYLDNSLSMQIKSQNMDLLTYAKQDLLKNIPSHNKFTLYTNNKTFQNINSQNIKETLEQVKPTETKLTAKSLFLKIENELQQTNQNTSLVYISDLLNIEDVDDFNTSSDRIKTHIFQPNFDDIHNISIESAELISDNELEVSLKSNLKNAQSSLALTHKNELIGKLDVEFKDETEKKLIFKVKPSDLDTAELRLAQDQLAYDDVLYLHQGPKEKISILEISDHDSHFIKRIFKDKADYKLKVRNPKQVELIDIQNANLIILNALKTIPISLKTSIEQALKNQKNLVVIPQHQKSSQQEYLNLSLNGINIFNAHQTQEQKITKIHFKHPLYEGVFTEQIKNFDYPKTENAYKISTQLSPVLSFTNQNSFLAQHDHLFVFASDLNKENSNFTQSPLIVPSFIEISHFNDDNQELYYFSDEQSSLNIRAQIPKDHILKLQKDQQEFIPEQRNYGQTQSLNFDNIQLSAGHYEVMHQNESLAKISLNTNRDESHFRLENMKKAKSLMTESSLQEIFNNYNAQHNAISLWKWMLIFALVCFLVEILLIRFLK